MGEVSAKPTEGVLVPVCLPLWGPGAPGKQSGGLFSAEGGRQPRTGDREAVDEVIPSGARSARKTARWGRNARKMCQWHIFSEGRAAAPDKFSAEGERQPREERPENSPVGP